MIKRYFSKFIVWTAFPMYQYCLIKSIMNITACCRYWAYLEKQNQELYSWKYFILISPIWDLFLMNCEIRRGIFQNQVKLYFKKQDSEMEIATQNSSSISFIAITHFPQKYNAKLQTAKSLINKKTKISQLWKLSCALQIQCYAMIEYR